MEGFGEEEVRHRPPFCQILSRLGPTGKRKMQKSAQNRCIDAENVVSYQEIGNLLPQGDSGKEVFLC